MNPLFLSERHPVSHKAAILADEGTSVWLYMTDSGSDYPAADCWLLNTVPSPEHLNEYCDNNAPRQSSSLLFLVVKVMHPSKAILSCVGRLTVIPSPCWSRVRHWGLLHRETNMATARIW